MTISEPVTSEPTTSEPVYRASFDDLASRLTGEVVTPADPDWEVARLAWNLANDQRPDAVAVPQSAADIREIVLFARDNGLRVVPQGTGHLASPLGDLAGAILLHTSAIGGIDIDPEARVVRVGAGIVWGEVTEALDPHGLMALAGSSNDVGVVGYHLGGGYSWFARKYGLASSHVVSFDVVTVDGRLLEVSATSEPELFFALRGGGGNYAIVTAMTIRVFPVATTYAGMLMFPLERADEVMTAWEVWTRDLTDDATTCFRLLRLPPLPDLPDFLRGQTFAVVDGAIDREDAAAESLLAPLRALGPAIDTFQRMPVSWLGTIHMDPPGPVPAVGDGLIVADLPREAIDRVLALAGPSAESALLLADFRHLGGAVGRPDENGGAVDHLPGRFLVFATGIAPAPEVAAIVETHVRGLTSALAPWRHERDYLNFREVAANADRFYSAQTLDRLRAVKASFDQRGVIRSSHGL